MRLSGPAALSILGKVFRGGAGALNPVPRQVYFGEVHDGGARVDQALVTYFRAPNSYTGEDLVEMSCHGGILVSRKILNLLFQSGARPANPGEFTLQAFLNGKMDLTQAEAVMDLIHAQTELALRAANEQLAGNLGKELDRLRESLLTALAHVEAYVDFPDEHIDPDTGQALLARLAEIETALDRLLATADQGRVLRHGLRTVIYGEPNVGKSSLLNVLLGYDRAIVSEIPGTTRDTIEEVINVLGIPVRLIDTAGTRSSNDLLEKEGIRRTQSQVEQADLILRVVDASLPKTASFSRGKSILVLNKVDLGIHADWARTKGVRFSCKLRTGTDELNQAIWNEVMGGSAVFQDLSIAISARHQACIREARTMLAAAKRSLEQGTSPEFISVDLRDALDAIGEVAGRVDTEELLGKIFSEFCIGK